MDELINLSLKWALTAEKIADVFW